MLRVAHSMALRLKAILYGCAICNMVDSTLEKLLEDGSIAINKTLKEKEYTIFSELSCTDKLKMELIEPIRHTSDRRTKTKLIEEAADKLEKSTRTIRRMVFKVEHEGLSALATTVRSDKGQLRISPEWQEKIIKLYKKKRRLLNKKNKDRKFERLLVRFIVDNYNQNHYPRAKNQTRVSRWESMLLEPLEEIDE